jgi:hypothetical protein
MSRYRHLITCAVLGSLSLLVSPSLPGNESQNPPASPAAVPASPEATPPAPSATPPASKSATTTFSADDDHTPTPAEITSQPSSPSVPPGTGAVSQSPATPIDLASLDLSVRWEEEKPPAPDQPPKVNIFLRNHGKVELTNLELDVLIRGTGSMQEQSCKATLTLPPSQEVAFSVPLNTIQMTNVFTIDIPIDAPPDVRGISKVQSVEVFVGSYKRFKSTEIIKTEATPVSPQSAPGIRPRKSRAL